MVSKIKKILLGTLVAASIIQGSSAATYTATEKYVQNAVSNLKKDIDNEHYLKASAIHGGEGVSVQTNADGTVTISATNITAQSELMIPALWAEMTNKVARGELVPGAKYRITDYVATTSGDMNSRSANHPFDIIVIADSTNTLSATASAIQHTTSPSDYFVDCNLAAWELKYCLANDTSRFAWALSDNATDPDTGTGGRGVVYRLRDEFGNDLPYDFKGIQFKRWAIISITSSRLSADSMEGLSYEFLYTVNYPKYYSCQSSGRNNSTIQITVDSGTWEWCYTFNGYSNEDSSKRGSALLVYGNVIAPYYAWMSGSRHLYRLNNIVFWGQSNYLNTFRDNCHENTFAGNFMNNKFDAECCYNLMGYSTVNNYILSRAENNIIGGGGAAGTTGNVFGYFFVDNCIGQTCSWNVFGDYVTSCTFERDMSSCRIGNSCVFLSIRGQNIQLGSDCNGIICTNPVRYITFEDGISGLDFQAPGATRNEYCQNITFKSGDYGTWDNPYPIVDTNVNQRFHTTYKPHGSIDIDASTGEIITTGGGTGGGSSIVASSGLRIVTHNPTISGTTNTVRLTDHAYNNITRSTESVLAVQMPFKLNSTDEPYLFYLVYKVDSATASSIYFDVPNSINILIPDQTVFSVSEGTNIYKFEEVSDDTILITKLVTMEL